MANPLSNLGSHTRGSATPAYITLQDGRQVPTDIVAYCAWLNSIEKRHGKWFVIGEKGSRTVDWREESASGAWLKERGISSSEEQ